VKLSPPVDPASTVGSEQLRALVSTAQASGIVDGFVVSNTAGDREVKLSPEGKEAVATIGKGGLSGRPLCNRSTATIRKVYELSGGSMPIIGVGGVDSAESAYAKIRAGASLVEVYTAIVYKGPGIFFDIHIGLRRLLEKDGFTSISEAVGADFKT
jgi:dihydroorotate dehydrogenase